MRENYEIKIHDMNTNRIHVYKVLATSFEDAYLQAKVLHNHFMFLKGNAELISIVEKKDNENR